MAVVEEAAAGEISRVSAQFPGDLDGSFPRAEIVDGTDVVETTAGDEIARWRIGAGHDPGRAQGDSIDLVSRVGVPDDQLAVLRGRDQVPLI